MPSCAEIIAKIRSAFANVKLEDGIGLWQAQAIDDYEPKEIIQRARERDEKADWSAISKADLSQCYSSLSFFDSHGMRFHLPAFLIAELEGNLAVDPLFTLTDLSDYRRSQLSLLSPAQREAVAEFLRYAALQKDYEFERPQIKAALKEYWTAE